MSDPLDSMLDLMRRLPPTQIEESTADDLLGNVDQLLEVKTDAATEKETFMRAGVAPRLPWFNEYDPPLDDGTAPPVKLRKLETPANEANRSKHVDITPVTFRYYEGGISSVYLWDLNDGGSAGTVLFRKGRLVPEHDFSVQDSTSYITNTGRVIEDTEVKMRGLSQEAYFGKTEDIVCDLRSVEDPEQTRRQRDLQNELVGFIKR
ncbi:subunits of heterodimeric actin filament capping protein Capz [Thelephora ganbajun]|uniref:Subunits of heterodimeric actin filament capping protein Capz n=1 Tax=Thelephora ganbajun TaxID=370292 RepID=A0ACB6ZCK9_THEGA|nr:subunits of heterodimeric actin filament capping protein Capz [Thelephora ganbajun]